MNAVIDRTPKSLRPRTATPRAPRQPQEPVNPIQAPSAPATPQHDLLAALADAERSASLIHTLHLMLSENGHESLANLAWLAYDSASDSRDKLADALGVEVVGE